MTPHASDRTSNRSGQDASAASGARVASLARLASVRVALILNESAREAAHGDLTRDGLERALRARGLHGEVIVIRQDEDRDGDLGEDVSVVAERLAREGADIVVAVGGDGTVHGVATGLLRALDASAEASLGIIPAGTMNNVAAALGIPEDVDAALDLIAASVALGVRRRLDMGMIVGKPFIESSGFGIISDLMCIGESVKQHPLLAPTAIPQIARLLGRYRPARVTLMLDGKLLRTRALHVRICNAPVTGMRIVSAPGARMDDGLLDVVVYEHFRPIELLAYLLRRVGGAHIPSARVRRFRARHIMVQPAEAWPIDLDGELIGHCGPASQWRRIEARVLPGALNLAALQEKPHIAEGALQTILRALPVVPDGVPAAVEAVEQAALSAEQAVTEATAAAEEALQGALQQVTEPPRQAARRASRIRLLYLAGGVAALGISIAASRTHLLPGDLRLTRTLQRTRSPLADRFWSTVAWAGFPKQSIPLVAAGTLGLWLARFRLEALFLLLASCVNLVNFVVKRVVRRQRPTEGVVHVSRLIREPSFPSGHVMHYVATLGFVAAAALANLRSSRLRRVLVGACSALIVLVGPSRVYLGAHWPSDVAAGYVFGGLYLGGVLELYSYAKQQQALFGSLPALVPFGPSANEAAARARDAGSPAQARAGMGRVEAREDT